MCILFMHVNPHPNEGEYRLIVAANRDEHYKRPADYAYQCKKTGVIGGKDMEPGREGGMWLGVVTKGSGTEKRYCFSAILNITGDKLAHADGRGVLVEDYLENPVTAEEYMEKLKKSNKHFNGYNLVAVELSKEKATTFHLSNTPVIENTFTGKQTLSFGNSPTTNPLKKVVCGKEKFQSIIDKKISEEQLIEELLLLLKDEESHLPDEELEKRAPLAFSFLSSIFVKIEEAGYGTRAHSIVLVDKNWNLLFIEHALEQPIDIKNPKWKINVIKSNL